MLKHKLTLIVLSFLLLALPAAVQAQLIFKTNNGAITITGFHGSGTTVVIPAATNGYPVVNIQASAFASAATISSVTIPNSVSGIWQGAFAFCTGLNSVTIGTGIYSIDDCAFAFCTNLAGSISKVSLPFLARVFSPMTSMRPSITCRGRVAAGVRPIPVVPSRRRTRRS